jgi:hypothetical protein
MFLRKLDKVGKRLVWRMSTAHPAGVYVTFTGSEPPAAPPAAPAAQTAPAEPYERGFRRSAFELSSGAEVIETAMDALPGEFADQFPWARG